ncbi:MAG: putative DNA binding domain-containing protein [Anaerolineae bacterium]|nr:putative DNA binding domain-containing protein [Anaerolineae bacterium]
MNSQSKQKMQMQWYRLDLHLHTPGSGDYQEPDVSYLDILRRAELRGLDIIAFTDHNTVKGYDRMMQEIQQLELLVRLDRAQPEERRRLAEYRRLLSKILVLPGFEFTATFGFHILGIFSPNMKVREIEHILLSLNIPPTVLEEGNSNVGASSDVLSSYRAINNAGGICIAAHVNSAHGVAMRGFDFGGQTKIAYTQDPHLHALEVTDLERRGRGATASFFNGTKPEYPRQMRCIQGSDAHRLIKDPRVEKNLGIGDRVTEVLLPEKSFEALRQLFQGTDFARSRPYRGASKDFYDHVHIAREAGPNIVQSFYDAMDQRSGKLYSIVADVCAFANTNGGTIYIGAAGDITIPVIGVDRIGESIDTLRDEISHKITPPLEVDIDTLESNGKPVIRVRVPRGSDLPYALDESKIYIRQEAETVLAVRDEIVRLVSRLAPAVAATAVAVSAPVQPQQNRPQQQPQRHHDNQRGDQRDQRDQRRGGQNQNQGKQGRRTGTHQQQRAVEAVALPEVAPELAEAAAIVEPPASIQPEVPVPAAEITEPAETGQRRRRGRPSKKQTIESAAVAEAAAVPVEALTSAQPEARAAEIEQPAQPFTGVIKPPRTGVEIVGTETRKGEQFHVMRDLRNGNIVKNVTRQSARRLWHYAIMEKENNPVDANRVQWNGNIGLWKRYKRGDVIRYDLVMKDNGSPLRVFFGVTEDGMHGAWQQFISDAEPEIVIADEG